MRILFCNYEYPPLGGGGGVVNAALAEEMAKKHEVTVLSSQAMRLPALGEINGVRVVRVPVIFRRRLAAANFPSMLAFLPAGILKGRSLLRAEKFDIINTHFVLPSGPVGQHLGHFSDTPNVVSVHGGDLYDPSKRTSPHRHALLRAWIRRLLRDADCVVGQSRNTLDNMRTYYTPEIDGIRIPLGIDRPPDALANRTALGIAEKDMLLVTVGRLVARKAIDQLIRMVKSLDDSRIQLAIVGSGPLEQSLREQISSLQLTRQVRLMGQVDEALKQTLLASADAFVSTSQHEGFGLVFLEAMARGLPVVCYDKGGQTDFLRDGVTGGLIRLNDDEKFATTIKALADDPDKAARIGRENLRRVEEFFIDTCAARYEALFEQVLADR